MGVAMCGAGPCHVTVMCGLDRSYDVTVVWVAHHSDPLVWVSKSVAAMGGSLG